MPMDFLSCKRYDYKASAITACTFLVYVRETSIMSTRIAFLPMARAGRVKSSDNDNRAKALFRSRSTGNNERRIVDPSRPSQADPFFLFPLLPWTCVHIPLRKFHSHGIWRFWFCSSWREMLNCRAVRGPSAKNQRR